VWLTGSASATHKHAETPIVNGDFVQEEWKPPKISSSSVLVSVLTLQTFGFFFFFFFFFWISLGILPSRYFRNQTMASRLEGRQRIGMG
jgi:hypothetical protein